MGRHQADTKKAYRKRRRQRKKVEENIQKTANPTVTSTCKSDDELNKTQQEVIVPRKRKVTSLTVKLYVTNRILCLLRLKMNKKSRHLTGSRGSIRTNIDPTICRGLT